MNGVVHNPLPLAPLPRSAALVVRPAWALTVAEPPARPLNLREWWQLSTLAALSALCALPALAALWIGRIS